MVCFLKDSEDNLFILKCSIELKWGGRGGRCG